MDVAMLLQAQAQAAAQAAAGRAAACGLAQEAPAPPPPAGAQARGPPAPGAHAAQTARLKALLEEQRLQQEALAIKKRQLQLLASVAAGASPAAALASAAARAAAAGAPVAGGGGGAVAGMALASPLSAATQVAHAAALPASGAAWPPPPPPAGCAGASLRLAASVAAAGAWPEPPLAAAPAPVPRGSPASAEVASAPPVAASPALSEHLALQEARKAQQAEAKAAHEAKLAAQEKARARAEQESKMRCHLHIKPNKGCRFCKRHQEFLSEQGQNNSTQAAALTDSTTCGGSSSSAASPGGAMDTETIMNEIVNKERFGFSQTVVSHITDNRYYLTLTPLTTLEDLTGEIVRSVTSVEPYLPDCVTTPSHFLCIVYRMFTLAGDAAVGAGIRRLMDSDASPYVRCAAFVFLRFGLPADRLWPWLGRYSTDVQEFQTTRDPDSLTTVGDFVEALLLRDKYYCCVLPRVTGGVRRLLEERLAPAQQCRSRARANRGVLDLYARPGARVEVSIDGEWHAASTLSVDDHPSRPQVTVRLEAEGRTETVYLGRIILLGAVPRAPPQWGDRGRSPPRLRLQERRSRSRSRTPPPLPTLACTRGKSDSELIEELRKDRRDSAVSSGRQDYMRHPPLFDKGLALAREHQGAESRRLLEEETFVKVMTKKEREEAEEASRQMAERLAAARKQEEPSDERKARLRHVFEKYVNVKARGEHAAPRPEVDAPETLRLG